MRPNILTVAYLAVMMLIIPFCLSAQFSGGTGTVSDPYLIASATDLNNVRSYPGFYFLQTGDINLNVAPYNVGGGWHPIGSVNSLYHYDGGGHKITGLRMTPYIEYDPKGLFLGLSGGYIRNLSLKDFYISSTNAGALAQSCSGTQIENCHVSGDFQGSPSAGMDWVGGLVSEASNSSSFNNCSAWITGMGLMSKTGGIVGFASDSSIDSCRAYVDIGDCSALGGLAAKVHNSTVSHSSTSGRLTGGAGMSGGLIGEISASEVSFCFANLEMASLWDMIGGLAGLSHSGSVISNCHVNVWFEGTAEGFVSGFICDMYGTQIINCYSSSVQNGAYCYTAIGFMETDCSITNSYYNRDLMIPEDDDYQFTTGRTTTEMTWPPAANTYIGWDFQNVWQEDPNYDLNAGYPRLRNLDYSCFVPSPKFNIPSGAFSNTLVFEISCSDPEAEIHYTTDGSMPDLASPLYTGAFMIGSPLTVKARAYKPGLFPSSINISEIWTDPPSLVGSGTVSDPFRIFNREQFCEINANLDSHFKLFANIDLSYYQDHTLAVLLPFGKYSGPNASDNRPFTGSLDGNGHVIYGGQITGTDQDAKGLFAYCNGAEITDLQVCLDSVQGNSHTGYLAGVMLDSEVSRCLASGDVISGNGNAGLLIGQAENCIIDQCFSIGSVTGANCNGGLIGKQIEGTVSDSYSLAAVTEAHISGGLIGSLNGSGLVERCYSAGLVSGEGTWIGGLVGNGNPEMVTDSFWDMQSSGQTQSAGGTACNTLQMYTEGTYVNWDLQHIWFPPVSSYNLGYPRLRHNQITVSVEEQVPSVQLLSFWPNPFRSDLHIRLDLSRPSRAELSVFNVRGQIVKQLLSGPMDSGNHELVWDGKDERGIRAASGIYFIRIKTNGIEQVHKCLLLK